MSKKTNHFKAKFAMFFILACVFALPIISATWTSNLNTDLREYYKLNETTGINVIESVFGSNNGTNSNAVVNTAGKIGTAYNFTATNNAKIDFGFQPSTVASNFSVSLWFKYVNGLTGEKFLVSWGTIGVNGGISSGLDGGSQIGIVNNAASCESTTTVNNNNWHMATVTYNGTSAILYIDGNFNCSLNVLLNIGSGNLGIGYRRYNSDSYIDGLVDEIGIWNRTLSASEVTQLYNGGTGITYQQNLLTISSPSPDNNSLFLSGTSMFLNGTANLEAGVSDSYFQIDGTNYCHSANVNNLCEINFTGLSNGLHNWTFFANDTSNTLFQTGYYNFNITSFIENGNTFNMYANELSVQSFNLNISYSPSNYPLSIANLIYNGTSYPSTITSVSGNNYIFNSNVIIPLINTATQNNSFYWSVVLTNSTGSFFYNTSAKNQTVTQLSLDNCTTNTIKIANITAYDQDTLNRLNGWNFQSTLHYGSLQSYRNVTFNFNNITEIDLCTNVNSPFQISGQLQYSLNNSYQLSNYYLVNQNFSNQTTNISLGLLSITQTTVFIVKLLNQYSLPVPGYYININRYYPGTNSYATVQTLLTDNNGQSVGFIEINNVNYQFQVLDPNGTIIYTSPRSLITPQSSPYTITINLLPANPSVLTYDRNITGLSYSLSFDKTTKVVTYAYADTNASFTQAELRVFQLSGVDNNLVCDVNLTVPNGVIVCNVSNYTGSFSAQIYDYRNLILYYVNNLTFDITNFNPGALGILGGICILLVCGFLFSFNEVAGIISLDLGVIAVNLMGLINFGWVVVSAVIAASIIILVVLQRG